MEYLAVEALLARDWVRSDALLSAVMLVVSAPVAALCRIRKLYMYITKRAEIVTEDMRGSSHSQSGLCSGSMRTDERSKTSMNCAATWTM